MRHPADALFAQGSQRFSFSPGCWLNRCNFPKRQKERTIPTKTRDTLPRGRQRDSNRFVYVYLSSVLRQDFESPKRLRVLERTNLLDAHELKIQGGPPCATARRCAMLLLPRFRWRRFRQKLRRVAAAAEKVLHIEERDVNHEADD